MAPGEYVQWDCDRDDQLPQNVYYVSHRWITGDHPDPCGAQLSELKRRLGELISGVARGNDALVFYDYCSIPQRPHNEADKIAFHRDLDGLQELSVRSDKVIILSEGYQDFRNRAWCFFELLIAEGNINIFEDQEDIIEDMRFRASLLPRPEAHGIRAAWITPGSFKYEIRYPEIEVLVASFQHLASCRATHVEDIPLVRAQLARYYDSRQMTPFARFVTAAARFFDISLVLVPLTDDSVGPVECKPYFDEPVWPRIQISDAKGPGILAAPPTASAALSRGFLPFIKLTSPDLPDGQAAERFLRQYYDAPDWSDYVVEAAATIRWASGHRVDMFQTVRHVVHTALERLGGLGAGPGCLYLQLFDPSSLKEG